MLKLAKYLKPFWAMVLLALVFLFGQALSDLNLPNLMSDIVNVGIQQGGIERASPEAISPEGMEMMLYYMADSDKKLVSTNYTLVSAEDSNENGKTYRMRYPLMGDLAYIRNYTDKPTAEQLDEAFGQAAYTFVNRLQEMAEASGQESDLSGSSHFDIQSVYQIHAALAMMPDSNRASGENTGLNANADQTGVMFVRAFYEELGVDTGAIQTRYIMRIGLYMLLIALLGGIASVVVGYLAPRVAAGLARNLRRDLFNKVEGFSHHEFDKFSSASLITRCTNDVTQVQMLVGMGIRMMCYAPIMGIGGIIMALNQSLSMSWVIALAVIVLLGLILIVMIITLPRFKKIQKLIDNLNRVSRENLSGLMVIRAFGTQKHEQARFEKANSELTENNLFVQRIIAFMMPAIGFIMNGVTLLIVWVGANQIAASSLQIGSMMAFMQYAMHIIMSFMMISIMFIFVPRAAVSGDRIAEVLGTELSVTDPSQPKPFNSALRGTVEFKHVHFRYHNAEEDALSDISFTARPGETTAIIGPTGSGKSTAVNLLMRFYDVSQGSIVVDGVDIREVNQKDLREKIGYVPQKGVLLTGTVASNLRYGRRDASDKDIETAAEVAQAMEFIADKPERFELEIAQGGTNVSGGQKQRLSIARALAKKPEILVFDDSFSALDFKTDAKLRRALKEHTADATVIVVAQRVGTIMNAEQIIVLEDGVMVGKGTHKELLKTCPAYYEIASSQLAERITEEGTA